MAGYAIIIDPDGTYRTVEFPQEADTVDFLQDAVGGLFDVVRTKINGIEIDMWVNDEGLLVGLPLNRLATHIHETRVGNEYACIVGAVIITGGPDQEGNTIPLNLDQAGVIDNWLDARKDIPFSNKHFTI